MNNTNKQNKMTIKTFVLSHNEMGINQWIETIEKAGFSKHESEIIKVADALNKIKINHKATFVGAINK